MTEVSRSPRVLVTGADGFVGRHLLPALRAHWPAALIVAAARQPVAGADRRVDLDLRDEASVAAAIDASRPDVVLHLAGQASVAGAAADAASTWSVNFLGSFALARAVAATVPDALVLFVSSAEVYGATFNDQVADERSPLRPLSAYARSKAAAEAMFGDVLPATARLIVARPSNHSGAGQSISFAIPSFARQIAEVESGRQDRVRVGRLDSHRDFLDVGDVVRCYLLLLDAAASLPPRSVFNIAAGRSVRVGDLLDRLRALAAADIAVEADPARMRPSEVPDVRVDAGAIRALGWRPRVPLDDTLAAVLADQRERCATTCA